MSSFEMDKLKSFLIEIYFKGCIGSNYSSYIWYIHAKTTVIFKLTFLRINHMQVQTYNITDNVNLRVNTLTIQGHIVFEVNSMVLNYHGTEYTMRDRVFKDKLTSESFRSIKSIELANYLARLIYGVNLFDIYRNQVEDEHTVNELDSYVFK